MTRSMVVSNAVKAMRIATRAAGELRHAFRPRHDAERMSDGAAGIAASKAASR